MGTELKLATLGVDERVSKWGVRSVGGGPAFCAAIGLCGQLYRVVLTGWSRDPVLLCFVILRAAVTGRSSRDQATFQKLIYKLTNNLSERNNIMIS
jgi:hypothetical protein